MEDEIKKTRILFETAIGLAFVFFTYNQSVGHSILVALVLEAGDREYLTRLVLIYSSMLLVGLILLGMGVSESIQYPKFVPITVIAFIGAFIIAMLEVSSYLELL